MSHRRYKVGKFPEYDRLYDRQKSNSGLLNPWGSGGMLHPDVFRASQRETLPGLLLEFAGQPSGPHAGEYGTDEGGWRSSKLKFAEITLAAVTKEWEASLTRAKRSGQPPPESWPPALIAKKLEAEAVLDIVQEEVDALKKQLEKYLAPAQKAQDDRVLAYGPRGDCWGEPPREIDGQPVATKDGELIINCPQSPYNLLKLIDYYAIVVRAWHQIEAEKMRAREAALAAGAKTCDLPIYGNRADPADFPPRPEGL